jgi:hypothetical protein
MKKSSKNRGMMKNVHSFLDQRKQAKMQWLQNPNRSYVDNLSNLRCEASRYVKKKEGIFEN